MIETVRYAPFVLGVLTHVFFPRLFLVVFSCGFFPAFFDTHRYSATDSDSISFYQQNQTCYYTGYLAISFAQGYIPQVHDHIPVIYASGYVVFLIFDYSSSQRPLANKRFLASFWPKVCKRINEPCQKSKSNCCPTNHGKF
jgi:hypothetical protein